MRLIIHLDEPPSIILGMWSALNRSMHVSFVLRFWGQRTTTATSHAWMNWKFFERVLPLSMWHSHRWELKHLPPVIIRSRASTSSNTSTKDFTETVIAGFQMKKAVVGFNLSYLASRKLTASSGHEIVLVNLRTGFRSSIALKSPTNQANGKPSPVHGIAFRLVIQRVSTLPPPLATDCRPARRFSTNRNN